MLLIYDFDVVKVLRILLSKLSYAEKFQSSSTEISWTIRDSLILHIPLWKCLDWNWENIQKKVVNLFSYRNLETFSRDKECQKKWK